MKKTLLFVITTFLILLFACSNEEEQKEESTDNKEASSKTEAISGGELRIAINSQPPTLDQSTSTASTTRDVARLIFETLVTTDSEYKPVPMLAESINISDDGKKYTFLLRKGIEFHNGEEMKAEDVVASMEYWMEKSTITGNIFKEATWEVIDEYNVELTLKTPSSLTLDTLASSKQSAAIMPKEIIEDAINDGVKDYIGTGPFKFKEWKQDSYIHFVKFDNYKPIDKPADGLSGKKQALVDDIYFEIVQDTTTRLAGIQTGQYDFAYGLPFDNYEEIKANPEVNPVISPSANDILAFNKKEGIAKDFKIRQAINTALNIDEIMLAAFQNEDLYWLDSGYMDISLKNWASTKGKEYYNQNNPEEAKRLLEEAGYNGEEFKILTTRDFEHLYNIGVVAQEQLKNIGVNASLEIYDWPTALDMQSNATDQWDAFVTSSQTVSTPPQLIALSPTWGGGMDDEKVVDMMSQIEVATTIEEAQALWDDLQLYAWEELLPVINLGGNNRFDAARKNVEGVTAFSGPIFWNVSLNE